MKQAKKTKAPGAKASVAVTKAKKSSRISPSSADAEATYPLSEWVVPATDVHGHSAKVFCRCPPAYKHLIATVLQKGLFPWETESDLVRAALHFYLKKVAAHLKDPEVTSDLAILNSLTEICSRQMSNARYSETLSKAQTTIDFLMSRGDEPMARKLIQSIASQIAHFEEPYWKEKYDRELLKAHKELLK